MKRRLMLPGLALVLAPLSGCGLAYRKVRSLVEDFNKPESAVEAALAQLRTQVLAKKADAAAEVFGLDAEWQREGQPTLRGQAAIRAHLDTLAAGQVSEFELVASSTLLSSGIVSGPDAARTSAEQKGRYSLKLVTAAGLAQSSAGSFEARWQLRADGRWLISRLRQTNGPAAAAAAASGASK